MTSGSRELLHLEIFLRGAGNQGTHAKNRNVYCEPACLHSPWWLCQALMPKGRASAFRQTGSRQGWQMLCGPEATWCERLQQIWMPNA